MNLDLLKKLTKLANHNPNDHEANSAARRVCKMLEEANWSLPTTVPPQPKPGTWSGFSNPRPPPQTAQTWNDVRRSQEPAWKSTPPNSSGTGFKPDQHYYDEMKNMTDEMYERIYQERARQQAQNRRPFYTGVDWGNDNPFQKRTDPFMNDIRNRRGYDPDNKKLMKCTKCGKDKLTGFVGNAATFICMDCVWS